MKEEFVILVNENDVETGIMEKMQAHKEGKLHRAFSVFILNEKNEMLLQKRAAHKYHSAGLWSNACCSHPRPKEETVLAAVRRLDEEIGLRDCKLEHAFSFLYKTSLENGLSEHEFDHVFIGRSNQAPQLNFDEASEIKYIALDALELDMIENSDQYSYWFKKAMPDLLNYLNSQ